MIVVLDYHRLDEFSVLDYHRLDEFSESSDIDNIFSYTDSSIHPLYSCFEIREIIKMDKNIFKLMYLKTL